MFATMKNAQVMSAFADRRSYRYEGREIDRQDHLGDAGHPGPRTTSTWTILLP